MSTKDNAVASVPAPVAVTPPPVPEPWIPGDKPVAYINPYWWGVMKEDEQKKMMETFAVIVTNSVPVMPEPEPKP